MPSDITKTQYDDKDAALTFYATMAIYAVGLFFFNHFHLMSN